MSLLNKIQERRDKNLGSDNEFKQSKQDFILPLTNNHFMSHLEDKSFYTTQVDNKEFVDSKQFLFQNEFKHVYLLSKRGIGKTYSLYNYIISTAVEQIKLFLENDFETRDAEPTKLPMMVGFMLINMRFTPTLTATLNELLSQHEIEQYVEMIIEQPINNNIGITVIIDDGGYRKFKKYYYFGECFYLTQPNYARMRQFNDLSFVVFDEFEKAFAKSLLDEDRVMVDSQKLMDNFRELLNSFQRNPNLRFLYLGNITNLNSVIWDFLNIASFDFKVQINEHEGSNDKVLILNLITLFTNEDMANYFEDLTTLGISEEELFQVEHLIDTKNQIESLDVDSFIIFTDLHIMYFTKEFCNIEPVNLATMNKLKADMQLEFEQVEYKDYDYEGMIRSVLNKYRWSDNKFTRHVIEQSLDKQKQKIVTKHKIPVYCLGQIPLNNTYIIEDKHDFLKNFSKTSYQFRSLRELFIYYNLIGKG